MKAPGSMTDQGNRYLWDMPALPGIPERLLNEIDSGTSSPSDIEKLLGSDPALAAKTLRIVNSDYYGLSREVDNLSQAILVLGMQQIRNLVMSVAVQSDLVPYESRAALRSLWAHAYGTAVGAHLVLQMKRHSQSDCEAAFLGGLTHDIGKLFLLSRFPLDYPCIREEALRMGVPTTVLESERFGTTHYEAGRRLTKQWRFPDSVRHLIGVGLDNMPKDASPILHAVHVADCLTGDPFETESAPRTIHEDSYLWLGWDGDEFDGLAAEIAEMVRQAQRFFDEGQAMAA